jgi:hypothetical protein
MALWLGVGGCGGKGEAPGPVTMNDQQLEEWQIALVEARIDKNEAFMDSTRSPLRKPDIPAFEGLNYYEPDPALRFRAPFVKEAKADTVLMEKHKGPAVPYVRKGCVSMQIGKQKVTLAVFGPAEAGQEDYLWLPFYDATSGQETYGGGRYLDLELGKDGTVEVDFNRAYNPLCDYNPEGYNCTLPPRENRLKLAVRAGEKLFRTEGTEPPQAKAP